MERATLVATVTTLPDGGLASLEASALAGVEWLEVRGDLVGDPDPAGLRFFPGRLLYTLRSRAEGGAFEGLPERRKRRLIEAAARYDLVDLEVARDLVPEVLEAVPAERRVLSWHGPAADLDTLKATFERMAVVPALLYKLVPTSTQPGEELPALQLLK
ncbi:MAG TPA: type I 3-dehydroquinate dehydratase, partial [Thermoanaerobaculia bacterium]|nr:type I 3-dehydroquinate dehydratase [Thermoanaerobaculia bacterium]